MSPSAAIRYYGKLKFRRLVFRSRAALHKARPSARWASAGPETPAKDNPDMADMLDKARVLPSGDRVILNLTLTDEQMASLIKHNTFALKM